MRAWAKGMNLLLIGSCIVLAVGAAASTATYVFLSPTLEGWRAFALKLGTEILGILFTVLLIEAVIRRKEERDRAWHRRRAWYRRIALRQLRIPLNNHLRLLSDMYKASVERKPDREISNLRDLFSEDYFEQITYFNAMGPSPAAHPMPLCSVTSGAQRRWIPWDQFLSTEVKQFKEEVDRVVDKYAMYLDPETMDLLERLANSPVVMSVGHLPMSATMLLQSWGPQQAYNPFIVEDDARIVRKHTDVFSKVVDIYNKEAPDDRKVLIRNYKMWSDGVAPAVGSSRASYRILENGLRWIPPASPTEPSAETEQNVETEEQVETEQSPDAETEQRPE